MQACKIFKTDDWNDLIDIENKINNIIKQGWEVKYINTCPVKPESNENVVITVLFEKPEETQQDSAID